MDIDKWTVTRDAMLILDILCPSEFMQYMKDRKLVPENETWNTFGRRFRDADAMEKWYLDTISV